MDTKVKERFIGRWGKYFPGAELPLAFYYTDEEGRAEPAAPVKGWRCVIGDLAAVRKGTSLAFDEKSVGCSGGKRYFGFSQELMPNFEYFLSCGIPGKLEGERYKKTPELVKELMGTQEPFVAPAKYLVFKPWQMLEEKDEPSAVIFFASADVLSGLFTLANFDESGLYGVITPFSAGCGSIVEHPYRELASEQPRAVLGMFDVSARPYVAARELSFVVPWNKFVRMVQNMEESFLITESWNKVRTRIKNP